MRIIIDGVFNHVGTTHPAFLDVQKNGRASPYADWFVIKSWDNPATPQNEFDYQGWYGVKDLPEVREEGDDLAPGFKTLAHAVVRRWMDPNGDGDPSDGIDGWRLDVAEMVPKGFWRQFRQWVREVNPQAYLTGEVWWENYGQNKMFNAAPWLQGDLFDAVMNYRFADGVLRFFVDTQNAFSAEQFEAHLAQIRRDYPPETAYVLMNLMSSHDTERLGSMVVNPDRMIDHDSSPQHNPQFDVRKPNAEERRTQKLIAAFQMLYPGAPMIYYGEEAGMWGADDPDERKPMVWPDAVYETERAHPLGKSRPADSVYFDQDLFGAYKSFIALRHKNRTLRLGDYQYVTLAGSTNLFAFVRQEGREKILCLFNRGRAPEGLTLPADFRRHEILAGEMNLKFSTEVQASLEGQSFAVVRAE
jgi:glycosidase